MCETSFSEWPLRDFPSHTWRSTEFRIGHFVSPVCPVSWNWATVSWLATCCHFQELALQTCKGKKFKQRPFFLSLSLSSYIDRIELILALACRAQFSRQSSFFKKKQKKNNWFSRNFDRVELLFISPRFLFLWLVVSQHVHVEPDLHNRYS